MSAITSQSEFDESREALRQHYAMVVSHGLDPRRGATYGPGFDDYAAMLRAVAGDAGLDSIPKLPWTVETLIDIDNRCIGHGAIGGDPLLD